jgi:uncharacterized protein YjdB
MTDKSGDDLTGVTIRWRSSNDAVATVAATGEVQGHSAGTATIVADASGRTQTSAIHVLARPPKPNMDPDRNK